MNHRMFVSVLGIALLGACSSAPIYNITDAPVVTASAAVSVESVKGAILRAGNRLGWQMSESSPGVINAHIELRGHTADTDVRYSAKTYSIIYRGSNNLDVSGDNIHKNYNGWVENLNRQIRSELASL